MMYVIQRLDGCYVAKLGSAWSYTRRLEDARKFPTRADAEREICPENERVVAVTDLL